MKLFGQHLNIEVLIRQILLNHVNEFLYKFVIRLFIFNRFSFQHQCFGINAFQTFALKNQVLYLCFQYFRIERLHHIVIRPTIRSLQYICIFCLGRQHQDRNMSGLLPFTYLPATGKPIFNRHHYIRDNQIGYLIGSNPDPFLTISRFKYRVFCHKQRANILTDIYIIFNNQQCFLCDRNSFFRFFLYR